MERSAPSDDNYRCEETATGSGTRTDLMRKLRVGKPSAVTTTSSSLLVDSPSPAQRKVHLVMHTSAFECCLVFLITLNLVMVVIETDMNASGEAVPGIVRFFLEASTSLYVIEISLRYYVARARFWQSRWNLLDTAIIVSDVAIMVVRFLVRDRLPTLSAMRILRLARLLRILRTMTRFRELQMLIYGLLAAIKSVFWALILLGVALALWSIVAVEVLGPITKDLEREGAFGDCERCGRSFESVGSAFLTFVQQVMMGDSWRDLFIPLIERRPFAGVLFLLVIGTINIGCMNLVIGVLVQTAQTARESIESEVKHEQWQKSKEELAGLFQQMDADGNGELVREELLSGFDSNAAFYDLCQSVNVDRDDIEVVYEMLDCDDSGRLSMEEFVDGIHEMRHEQSSLLLMFIKYSVNEIRMRTREQCRLVKACIGDQLGQMERRLHRATTGMLEAQITKIAKHKSGSDDVHSHFTSKSSDEMRHEQSERHSSERSVRFEAIDESDDDLSASQHVLDQAKRDVEQKVFASSLGGDQAHVQTERASQHDSQDPAFFEVLQETARDLSSLQQVYDQPTQDVEQKPVRSNFDGEEHVGAESSLRRLMSPESKCSITLSRDPVYLKLVRVSDTEPGSPPPVVQLASFDKQDT